MTQEQRPLREGFWSTGPASLLPVPKSSSHAWIGKKLFLGQLVAIEDHYLKRHKEQILAYNSEYSAYMEKYQGIPHSERPRQPVYAVEQTVTGYRGWSSCRICSCHNGSLEFSIAGWVWPSGYRHYIEEHNVQPPLAFLEFIMQVDLK